MTKKLDYGEFIQSGDLVFDVGANVGVKTSEYLALGATVICFEPSSEALEVLRSRYGNNPRVVIEPVGLYDHEGTRRFFPAKVSGQSTFSRAYIQNSPWFPPEHWKTTYFVKVSTLDIMFKKWGVPRFLKVDVESSEVEVLSRMNWPVDALSFEFHVGEQWKKGSTWCVNFLHDKFGYRKFNYIVNDTIDGVGIESNEYRFDDWVDKDTHLAALNEEPRHSGMNWGDVYARI